MAIRSGETEQTWCSKPAPDRVLLRQSGTLLWHSPQSVSRKEQMPVRGTESLAIGRNKGTLTARSRTASPSLKGPAVSKDGGSMRARRSCAHVGWSRTSEYVQVHPGPANTTANRFRISWLLTLRLPATPQKRTGPMAPCPVFTTVLSSTS